ncbi:hypothetical protein MLD38_028498 [Melastoma candidum]|uniref:Uncharacterized protein n=1 Tax=Melastoma candidum TaxID=119954 RepID=A0ACB9N5J5_9MYRT|nr:hypothetical protein MLD38_028498 [Melastoma candidum]
MCSFEAWPARLSSINTLPIITLLHPHHIRSFKYCHPRSGHPLVTAMPVFALSEPVLQTTSSPLLPFIACNIIIFLILIGSRFGGSRGPRTTEALPVFGVRCDLKCVEVPDVEPFPSDQIACSSSQEKQREEKPELEEVCEVETNRGGENEDNGWECVHEEEKEEGDYDDDDFEGNCDDFDGCGDDELKRRIEDFIAKVNREWAAEKSMALDEPLALIMTSA